MEPLVCQKEVESVIAYKLKLLRKCFCVKRGRGCEDWHPLSDHLYSESSWVIDLLPLPLLTGASDEWALSQQPSNERSLSGLGLCQKIIQQAHVCTDPSCSSVKYSGNSVSSGVSRLKLSGDTVTGDDDVLDESVRDVTLGCKEAFWILDQVSEPERFHSMLDKPERWQGCYTGLRCPQPDCGRLQESVEDLQMHTIHQHDSQPLKCSQPSCDFTSSTDGNLKRHMMKHRRQKYKFKYGKRDPDSLQGLRRSKNWSAKTFQFKRLLKLSGKKVKSNADSKSSRMFQYKAKNSMKSSEYQCTITCTECEEHEQYSLRFRKLAVMHSNLQEKGTSIHCIRCQKITKATGAIQEVDLDNNEKDLLPIPSLACDRCPDLKCSTINEWTAHIKTHSHDPHKCPLCGSSFANKIVLDRHINNMHSAPRLCEICGKHYRHDSHFERHKSYHPCVCAECGKSFSRRRYLTKHMLVVHADPSTKQTFLCNVCGQEFRAYSSLWSHQERHRVGKVSCKICSKVFSSHRNLKVHNMTRHSGRREQIYCPKCDKAFITEQGLKIHDKNRHSESENRPEYICEQCGKKFISKNGYKIHCRNHHK